MKKKINIILFMFCTYLIYAQNQPVQRNQSKPVQKGYQHSSSPINVMGFTYESTISEVKEQLDEWGFVWNKTSSNIGIQIKNIDWYGINLEVINFMFDKNGQLSWILLSPNESESSNNIMKAFKEMLKDLPYRNQVSKNYTYGTTNYTIYNGMDESEFAVISISGKYIKLNYYLNNSITECTGLKP